MGYNNGRTMSRKARALALAAALLPAAYSQAAAQRIALPGRNAKVPDAFVTRYLRGMELSLRTQPFFASMVLGALDTHLKSVNPMGSPKPMAEYLGREITGRPPTRRDMAKAAARLGTEPLSAEEASAMLLANALVNPGQARQVLEGMERLHPMLGQRVSSEFASAPSLPGSSAKFMSLIHGLGGKLRPQPFPGLYDSKGRLEGLFDGAR